MFKNSLMMILLLASLAACATKPIGDFCVVADRMETDSDELARLIVQFDRHLAEIMAIQNERLDDCPNSEA